MKLLCSNGVKAVMLELMPDFERKNGARLDITWASTNMLLDQIAGGASGDLTILTGEAIEDLIAQGKLVPGSRTDLARSAIGVAIRKGAPKPDVTTVDAFKLAMLTAKSICYSKTGVSGLYFPTVMARLGITDAMRDKIVIPQPGRPVGELIARGEAEIGIQQISELLPVSGIEIVGPFPDALQKMTIFSAGVFRDAEEPDAAKALVEALTAPATRPLYASKGMEPVGLG